MKIGFTREDLIAAMECLKADPTQMLLIDQMRATIARRRYLEFRQAAELNISDDKNGVASDAISHNLKALENWGVVTRTNRLVRALSVIDKVYFRAAKLKILSIGPRTEMELLNLVAHGFSPENIRGLDILSYSPWIDTGNMHAMPYPDSTFDVVIVGWVLAYSDDPELACREIARVTKDQGVIAVGATKLAREKWELQANGRGRKSNPDANDILNMFGTKVRRVYVQHDSGDDEVEGRTIVVFDVSKP
jgi:SAM-dependent methyltransferase